jgi:glycosyltransferase involved in cell wall biosynthesis
LDFHFVLAGSNPQDPEYEEKIRQKIKQSILVNHTTITGFVRGNLKLGLLQEADLFILPSSYENFGIAVAEAMAIGTPVVISDGVYIWQDIKASKAGWVTSCEVEDLRETLRLALKDANERKIRGVNARRLASDKYSWQAIAQQTIQAYQHQLKQP